MRQHNLSCSLLTQKGNIFLPNLTMRTSTRWRRRSRPCASNIAGLSNFFCHVSKNIFTHFVPTVSQVFETCLNFQTCQFRKHFGDRPWSGDGQSGEALVRETNGQFSCNKFNFSRNKFNFSRHTWSCTAKTSKSLVKPNIGQFNHTLWPSFAQQNIFDRLIRYLRYHQIKCQNRAQIIYSKYIWQRHTWYLSRVHGSYPWRKNLSCGEISNFCTWQM